LGAQSDLALQTGAVGTGAVLGFGAGAWLVLGVPLQVLQRLAHQCGFAYLAWASDHLYKQTRLLEPGKQRGKCFAFDGHF